MKNKPYNGFYDTGTGLLVYLKGLDNWRLFFGGIHKVLVVFFFKENLVF